MVAAAVGFGMALETNDVCQGIVKKIAFGVRFGKDLIYNGIRLDHKIKRYADCDSRQASFNRMFCDLHCIRDAVKAGDKAILSTLEKSVEVMGRNMDMLMEYHTLNAK